jgi:hypothetical protein
MLSTDLSQKPATELTWDQRLLRNSGRNKTVLRPEYQELKFTLHRKLLDKINLEALATIDNQRVRSEVRQAVIALIDGEPTLLSSLERQQISEEVLDGGGGQHRSRREARRPERASRRSLRPR